MPAAVAGGHRHQRQDDHGRHARGDPARRRARRGGLRQRRLPGGRRRSGEGARRARRGAVELPAALVAVGACPPRGACSTSPRTTSTGTARWPPTPRPRRGRCAGRSRSCGVDDPAAAALLAAAPAREAGRASRSAAPGARPARRRRGARSSTARSAAGMRWLDVAAVTPGGPPGLTDALAAAALARAHGVAARRASRPGWRRSGPGGTAAPSSARSTGSPTSTTPRRPTRTPPPRSLAAHGRGRRRRCVWIVGRPAEGGVGRRAGRRARPGRCARRW